MSTSSTDTINFTGPIHIRSTGSTFPDGVFEDKHISAIAAIDASKLDHQHALTLSTNLGSAVADVSQIVHVAKEAGTLVSVSAALNTAIVGDSTISVDVQLSTGGGAFATMLYDPIEFTVTDAALTAVDAVLGSTVDYVAGDLILIIVNATAGTGTLGQGLCVTGMVREAA